jgi:hypothetical protein
MKTRRNDPLKLYETVGMLPGGMRGRHSLKLLGPVRGPAVLHFEGCSVPVAVDASEYEERGRISISGGLEGDLSARENGEAVRLVLADGRELDVRLIEPDDAGADFRTA